MKPTEIHEMSEEELEVKEEQLIKELFNLRFQFYTGQLENSARMKQVRKDIARVKTERRSRELAAG